MGSPGSPAYAICICMYYEHQFHQSIYDHCRFHNIPNSGKLFRFLRYVDDVIGFVAYDTRHPQSLEFAKFIIEQLVSNTYHPNMILKAEPSSGWFGFLEALIHLTDNPSLQIRFHNKNYVPLLETGLPKIYSIQHRTSFMSRAQAVQKVCGALHCLRRVCDRPGFRVISTLELSFVYRAQGYTPGEIASALSKITHKTGEQIWDAMSQLVYSFAS